MIVARHIHHIVYDDGRSLDALAARARVLRVTMVVEEADELRRLVLARL